MEITRLNFFLQFLNLGVVAVLTDTSFTGFDLHWYAGSGVFLYASMIYNIFTSNGSEFLIMILDLIYRWSDRSFSMKLLKSNNRINTKSSNQSDLNSLYTGSQIKGGEKFGQMVISINICLMYSSGLPLLYPITMIYFAFSYWYNKILLLRYYERTVEFD